jgi:hypothetical protein
MTTVTKTPVPLLVAANGAAGSTKATASAGTSGANSGWKDFSAYDGGNIGLSITNGSSAPGVAPTILVQVSPDSGVTVYDYWAMGGDTTASSVNTATIWLDPGFRYGRVIGFGNTTNDVKFGADFSGVTRA